MLKYLFLGIAQMVLGFKETLYFWVCGTAVIGYGRGFLFRLIKRALYASFTCILAIGGAFVGIMVGAVKGQTTETGFLQGGLIGAVAGAITAVQLLESVADGQSLSKGALLRSIVNGKAFVELVSPAVLKAYQWQMMAIEGSYREISDMYDDNGGVKGLSANCIRDLPMYELCCDHDDQNEFNCPICLQVLREGEMGRKLEKCGHTFHMICIDEWLIRQGTCPFCRTHVFDDETDHSQVDILI